jgi:NADH dehydrogenase FAD-containing subunit
MPAMSAAPLSHFGDDDSLPTGPGYLPRTLVLLGAGFAHLQALQQLARKPLIGVQVVLVAPHPRQMVAARIPAWVAGRVGLEDCSIALEPLVQRAGVRWVQCGVRGLDAAERLVVLDEGEPLAYDWLSINTGPNHNRDQLEQAMPGVRAHGLFVRPIDRFTTLWPQVVAKADESPLRLAVIGGGGAGIELALAARARLPQSAITLVCGNGPAGANFNPATQRRIATVLRRRGITVLQGGATGFSEGVVQLGCGATLACDVPLIAVGAHAPAWLQGSGLALDAQGFVAVDACLRSTSHPEVLAAGDVSSRADQAVARNGTHALHAGAALVRNLVAIASGQTPTAHRPPPHSLSLLACGNGQAILDWGGFSMQGYGVGWLKRTLDRRLVSRFAATAR